MSKEVEVDEAKVRQLLRERSADCAPAACSAAVIKLECAIQRLQDEPLQQSWKCGPCNGWTGYFCPLHQAVDAMQSALQAIKTPNDKLTDRGANKK